MGQKLAAYEESGAIVAFYDTIDSPPPPGTRVIEISDEAWQFCLMSPGHTVVDGELRAPIPPTQAELLAQAKEARVAALSEHCAIAIKAGFTSSALGEAHLYPAQATDQQNLFSAVMVSLTPGLAAGWKAPLPCQSASGEWSQRDHNASQIQQVGQDGNAARNRHSLKNQELAAKVASCKTVEEVLAVAWE